MRKGSTRTTLWIKTRTTATHCIHAAVHARAREDPQTHAEVGPVKNFTTKKGDGVERKAVRLLQKSQGNTARA